MRHAERGSAIILMFVLVALFGLLCFAFMQGSRGGISWLKNEESKSAATKTQDCTNTVNMAAKRLEARGCGTKISYELDGANFAAGAPTDGSCSVFHTNGGGAKTCGNYDPDCITKLAVGESCAGVIYAGLMGSDRIYAAQADTGTLAWNVGFYCASFKSALSQSDGQPNTDIIVAGGACAPSKAAQACRARGPKWYLPAINEVSLLYSVRNIGAFSGTFSSASYWSSYETNSIQSRSVAFSSGVVSSQPKENLLRVRCVRKN